METRPWFKKLFGIGKAQAKQQASTVREFPLPEPQEIKRKRAQGRRGYLRGHYRNPIIRQSPSTDPRFNHALRRRLRETQASLRATGYKVE